MTMNMTMMTVKTMTMTAKTTTMIVKTTMTVKTTTTMNVKTTTTTTTVKTTTMTRAPTVTMYVSCSIAMYKDVEQAERLLRAIYQPQNIYCFHIDTKTSLLIHRIMRRLVACFDNVFIASHLDKIKWGDVRYAKHAYM